MMTDAIQIPLTSAGIDSAEKKNRYSDQELANIKKACADFESMFVYELLKTMRATIPKSTLAGSSCGKETYTMLMDQKLAEQISSRGDGMGISKALFDQITMNYVHNIPEEVEK